jgi:hypothetical protein
MPPKVVGGASCVIGMAGDQQLKILMADQSVGHLVEEVLRT